MKNQLILKLDQKKGRLDKVLAEHFTEYSRSQIQSWFKQDLVTVNENPVKANYKTKADDEIHISLPEEKQLELLPENIPLDIIYEDADVIVVNKPQGMVVHPSAGHATGTLVHALLYHVKDLSAINHTIRPGIVHRIDKDTSGLLMVAKNEESLELLAAELKEKKTERKYLALVHGVIPHEKGTIDAPIGRSKVDRKRQAVQEEGKPAVTHFTVKERFADYSLIECQLETGRTHQIRVHMQYIGYPVVGDPIYGRKKTITGQGQFLHAAVLGFTHPKTNEFMHFDVPLPEIFEETLKNLRSID